MNYFQTIRTKSLGELLLVADEKHLTGIFFADCKHAPPIAADWQRADDHPILRQATKELRGFLDGSSRDFSVAMRAAGTDFQKKVWQAIRSVPFGSTITYSELAQKIGNPRAVRAAGLATGQNPLSIIVPCHRIVGKNGALRGYAGGLERKQTLLALER